MKFVFKERGSQRVSVATCKKNFKFLRKVGNHVVERALHKAGLKWLTRRLKWKVPAQYKITRAAFAEKVLKARASTLARYAHTDGTTFYLARGAKENDSKKRAALGRYVWRMSSGKDGLFEDNVGPSLYAKGQGLPVKIWGFLANGHLKYWALPKDPKDAKKTTHMNTHRYGDLVQAKFVDWRRECFGDNGHCHLIQDHERCLWNVGNLANLKKAGCPVVEDYPKCSPTLMLLRTCGIYSGNACKKRSWCRSNLWKSF